MPIMQTMTDQHQHHPLRVLIVDNDDRTLHSLEAIVRQQGFDTRTTWSGHEALALMQSQRFDLVVVDTHLPDLYFGDFVRRASRHMAHRIIVMQKGRKLPPGLRRHKTLGVSAVMDKTDPLHIREVLSQRYRRSPPV